MCVQVFAIIIIIYTFINNYLDTKCTTVDDTWKEAPKCSISRSDVQSCSSTKGY